MKTLKLVFLTPLAYGHANVHYTILRNLLTEGRGGLRLELHVIGDEPQRKRLFALPSSEHATLRFHPMGDEDMLQHFTESGGSNGVRGPPLSLTRQDGMRVLQAVPSVMYPKPDVFLTRYQKIVEVLQNIQPDIFVVDLFYHALGVDATTKAGIPHVILCPVGSMDLSTVSQPLGRGFWRFPWLFTNHPFPVPVHLIPLNILYGVIFILVMVFHPKRRALDAARGQAGIPGSVLSMRGETARAIIHPSLPEVEYPHTPNPRTFFAGPILTPTSAVSNESYPDLASFFNGGRTILINLGSLFSYSEQDVKAVAEAIVVARLRLHDRGGCQVLWKLPEAAKYQPLLNEKLGSDREGVRIETWIDPPALAVLQHPNLVASIHHGGANSVIEAAYAGVPQIVIPAWFDLYTLAVRTEWLGHGIYANKGFEPNIDGPLLCDAIVRTLRDEEGEEGNRIKIRADEIGKICRKERGDRKAADAIIAAAEGEDCAGTR